MSIDLSGRVAIITGAGKGLGRAYALDLAARGARLVVNNRRHSGQSDAETSAFQTVEAVRALGGEAIANYSAVEDSDAGVAMVEAALGEFGRLDIVIANAAAPQAIGFNKISLEDFRYVFDVSFLGALNLVHAAWPHMREAGYGRIVTTSSSAGRYGQHGLSAYGAAKAAIDSLTKTLAAEGARSGIRVNAISPYAASQMTQAYMGEAMASVFTPQSVAGLVAWLSSEACNISGEVLVAGGGRMRRAYAVETASIPIDLDDMPGAFARLAQQPGIAFPNSNRAFDTLLVEAGLPPRKPLDD